MSEQFYFLVKLFFLCFFISQGVWRKKLFFFATAVFMLVLVLADDQIHVPWIFLYPTASVLFPVIGYFSYKQSSEDLFLLLCMWGILLAGTGLSFYS